MKADLQEVASHARKLLWILRKFGGQCRDKTVINFFGIFAMFQAKIIHMLDFTRIFNRPGSSYSVVTNKVGQLCSS